MSKAVKNRKKQDAPVSINEACNAQQFVTVNSENSSNIEQQLLQIPSISLTAGKIVDYDDNTLLFKFDKCENSVLGTSHPLAKLARMILFQNKITNQEFVDRHRAYAEAAGYLSTEINYSRNNIKKAMYKEKLSFTMFEQLINVIFGFELKDLTVKLTNPYNGKVETYSLSDISKKSLEIYGTNNVQSIHVPSDEENESVVNEGSVRVS